MRKLSSKLEHQGIKIELIGNIGMFKLKFFYFTACSTRNTPRNRIRKSARYINMSLLFVSETIHVSPGRDRGVRQFFNIVRQLATPGELHRNTSFDFSFDCRRPHESYYGRNVVLR